MSPDKFNYICTLNVTRKRIFIFRQFLSIITSLWRRMIIFLAVSIYVLVLLFRAQSNRPQYCAQLVVLSIYLHHRVESAFQQYCHAAPHQYSIVLAPPNPTARCLYPRSCGVAEPRKTKPGKLARPPGSAPSEPVEPVVRSIASTIDESFSHSNNKSCLH